MEEYNQEAEAAVLGGLLIDSKAIKKVMAIVNVDDFFERRHKLIFAACVDLDMAGSPIDLVTVYDILKKSGYDVEVGGGSYLADLTNAVPHTAHIEAYAKMVSDYAAKRRIKKAAVNIGDASSNGSSLEETLDIVKREIHDVNKLGGKQNKYQVASMLDYVEESKSRYEHWGQMQGLSSGFPSIDQLTLGLVGGELIIVAGPTSRGKTLLSMNIANNVAKNGGRVLFVTLEMTKAELTSRYMYVNDGWESNDFTTVAANTIFQQNDELDWKDIDGLIQNAKEELDVDLVIIDHLHYFARDIKNAAEELGRITMTFKKNAIRHKIPVILISHIRKLQKDEDLSGDVLRGSSLIAQDSDIVLMVNRDPETNEMGIMIDKNRNRGKLSDRTPIWGSLTERELNTVMLDFNNTKLKDPLANPLQSIFPGSVVVE